MLNAVMEIQVSKKIKTYYGIPLGAVFEAAQKSVRTLDFNIKEENISDRTIIANSKVTMRSFGQEIVLKMNEIGLATELDIAALSGQLSDWGEGDKLIENILSEIDVEIQKIRNAGRIKPIEASKFGFGESIAQTPMLNNQATTGSPPEKKGSGENWVLKVSAAGGLFWIFFTSSGAEFASSILGSLTVETNISQYDCEKAASLVTGESLQNVFGGQFRIIAVSDLKQVSATNKRIECTGVVDLSNGTSPRMRITVENGSSSSEVRFSVEPL